MNTVTIPLGSCQEVHDQNSGFRTTLNQRREGILSGTSNLIRSLGNKIYPGVRSQRTKQNTIKYEVVEDGVWAYIKEIPTTRVFGKTADDACLHLMMLIMNVEDKKKGWEGQAIKKANI